ncbi:MAG: hypothetical protein WC907_01370 [Acholeplasmataceae bacterium]
MSKEIYIPLIIITVILIISFVIFYLIRKKPKKKLIDVSGYANNLIDLLGGINNIITVTVELNRLKINLKDPSVLKKDKIKEEKLIAFLSGNEIKILIKENINEIKTEINQMKNEV